MRCGVAVKVGSTNIDVGFTITAHSTSTSVGSCGCADRTAGEVCKPMALISYLTTIRFGCGVLSEIPEDLDALRTRRPLVVTDKGVVAAGLIERLFAVMPAGMPQ